MTKTENGDNLLKSAMTCIGQLGAFECKRDLDPYWQIIFPVSPKQWAYLHVSIYRRTYYVNELISGGSLEVDPVKGKVEVRDSNKWGQLPVKWDQLFVAAVNWLKKAEKNWVTANKLVVGQFPAKYRKGWVPAAVVARYFPEYRHLQKDIGIRNAKKMVSIIDKGYLRNSDVGLLETCTANDFFEYCKLAYQAVGLVKDEQSGRDLYTRYADGRHEGLLDIDPASEAEFAAWIDGAHPKRNRGGHPWEILRGGNTSNIQLNVRRPMYGHKNNFKIEVYATGISRLAECIKIFLEIYKAGKPIGIQKPDTIREQLLLQDNIGILPVYSSLHRGVQVFEESKRVNHVIWLSHISKHYARIKPFIAWEPLPLLSTKFL